MCSGLKLKAILKGIHAKLLQLCPIFVTLWTVARRAPLSVGFSRQKYGSGLPFPSPGDLPDPVIELASPDDPALQAEVLLRSHW